MLPFVENVEHQVCYMVNTMACRKTMSFHIVHVPPFFSCASMLYSWRIFEYYIPFFSKRKCFYGIFYIFLFFLIFVVAYFFLCAYINKSLGLFIGKFLVFPYVRQRFGTVVLSCQEKVE